MAKQLTELLGISLDEFEIMGAMLNLGVPSTSEEIAERSGIEYRKMMRMLEALTKRGLVKETEVVTYSLYSVSMNAFLDLITNLPDRELAELNKAADDAKKRIEDVLGIFSMLLEQPKMKH